MKRLLAGLLLALCVTAAFARDISSSLGYKATVPDGWVALTREEVKANPDLIDFDKAGKNGMPRALLEQVKPMILNGQADIFLRSGNSPEFTDNVNVIKQVGNVNTDAGAVKAMCKGIGKELEAAFKHPVKVHGCETRKVGGKPAVYLDFDGVVPGTRSVQYQVPRSENVFLIITATASNQTLAAVRAEFERIVRSFRLS